MWSKLADLVNKLFAVLEFPINIRDFPTNFLINVFPVKTNYVQFWKDCIYIIENYAPSLKPS